MNSSLATKETSSSSSHLESSSYVGDDHVDHSYGSISDSYNSAKNSGSHHAHKELYKSISMGESFSSSHGSPGTNLTPDSEEESSPFMEENVIAPTGKI